MKLRTRQRIRRVTSGLVYPLQALKLRSTLVRIDREAPFQGELAKANVVLGWQLSPTCLAQMRRLEISGESVHIDARLAGCFDELFGKLAAAVVEYLGGEAFLDGMYVVRTEPEVSRISNSWHTDNVGNRLKCFVCLTGDGTQPTFIIPAKERIPGFVPFAYQVVLEVPRRYGLKNRAIMKTAEACRHNDGSVFLFDTQLLHRGGYEEGKSTRVVLILEFSDRRKHELTHGGTGTFHYNKFSFDEDLLQIENFRRTLDSARLQTGGESTIIYSEQARASV